MCAVCGWATKVRFSELSIKGFLYRRRRRGFPPIRKNDQKKSALMVNLTPFLPTLCTPNNTERRQNIGVGFTIDTDFFITFSIRRESSSSVPKLCVIDYVSSMTVCN